MTSHLGVELRVAAASQFALRFGDHLRSVGVFTCALPRLKATWNLGVLILVVIVLEHHRWRKRFVLNRSVRASRRGVVVFVVVVGFGRRLWRLDRRRHTQQLKRFVG